MLSIVILTYNSQRFIEDCLNAVFAQKCGEFEVIVVDNGSTDGTLELLRQKKEKIRLVENPRNFGVSNARNQGIKCSVGEWILALDSDVILGECFLEKFASSQKKFSEKIGMLQPNILDKDGREIYSQGIYLSSLRRFFDRNRGKPRDFVAQREEKIIGPCSAAAFYRRSMLDELKEKTGYFDERFFFLVEDVDLAWRASRRGWEVAFDPGMTCFHVGDSSATNKKLRQYLSFRNRHWMIRKNEGLLKRMVLFVISLPYEIARFILMMFSNRYLWKGI